MSRRERGYLRAWAAWVEEDDLLAAAAAFEAVVASYPRDLFALKRAQLLYFLGGKPRAMLAVRCPPAPTRVCMRACVCVCVLERAVCCRFMCALACAGACACACVLVCLWARWRGGRVAVCEPTRCLLAPHRALQFCCAQVAELECVRAANASAAYYHGMLVRGTQLPPPCP